MTQMKYCLTFLFFLLIPLVSLQSQSKGPHYFITDPINPNQFFWRRVQAFGGINVHTNYNLLAYLLGDKPKTTKRLTKLLTPQRYTYSGNAAVDVPVFVFVDHDGIKKGLLPGDNLVKFLNNPIKGGKFGLTLPFTESNVALSDASALMRKQRIRGSGGTDRIWHVAIDFDYTRNTKKIFDVVAPADGRVVHPAGATTMAIEHRASNGALFLTLYQHLDPSSIPSNLGRVKRGQFLGRIEPNAKGYAHLHFGVAVKGPAGVINGKRVPALWYVIDPFGVYDYRRNSTSNAYNYLPNNRLNARVKGRRHAYVFKTDPPIGSLPSN